MTLKPVHENDVLVARVWRSRRNRNMCNVDTDMPEHHCVDGSAVHVVAYGFTSSLMYLSLSLSIYIYTITHIQL